MPKPMRLRYLPMLFLVGLWIVGSVVWCSKLPGMFEAEFTLPANAELRGFSGSGQFAIFEWTVDPNINWPRHMRYGLLDVKSGRVDTAPFGDAEMELIGHTRDSRRWLFRDWSDSPAKFCFVDLDTRSRTDMPDPPERVRGCGSHGNYPPRLSSDGRYAILNYPNHSRPGFPPAVIWDLSTNRVVELPCEVSQPVIFSPDGRTVVAQSTTEPNKYFVLDVPQFRLRHTLIGLHYGAHGPGYPARTRIWPDGRWLTVEFRSEAQDKWNLSTADIVTWNLTTGELHPCPPQFACEGLILIKPGFEFDIDWRSTTPRVSCQDETAFLRDLRHEMACSPDGRTTLTVINTSDAPDPLRDLLFQYCPSLVTENWLNSESIRLYDNATRRQIAEIRAHAADELHWLQGGKQLAQLDHCRKNWRIWNVPPRKPMLLLVAGVIACSLPALVCGFLSFRKRRQ